MARHAEALLHHVDAGAHTTRPAARSRTKTGRGPRSFSVRGCPYENGRVGLVKSVFSRICLSKGPSATNALSDTIDTGGAKVDPGDGSGNALISAAIMVAKAHCPAARCCGSVLRRVYRSMLFLSTVGLSLVGLPAATGGIPGPGAGGKGSFRRASRPAVQIGVGGRRIIGGIESAQNEFPWLVHIGEIGGQTRRCAGVVVDQRWVLTAAHCFLKTGSTDFLDTARTASGWNTGVTVGCVDIASSLCRRVDVDRVMLHPCYAPTVDEDHDDVAMMHLVSDAGVSPAEINGQVLAARPAPLTVSALPLIPSGLVRGRTSPSTCNPGRRSTLRAGA